MEEITFVSLMSENHRPLYQGVTEYLGQRAGIAAVFANDVPWQERQRMLDTGAAQVAFICGLPYSRRASWLEPLAAPAPRAARYAGRPVYFSDVVVRSDSRFRSFAELRGAIWAINEPESWSGCVALRAHLAALGEGAGFCGRVVESGAHLRSIELILDGAIDAAAIDSSVLELELERQPALAGQLRIVKSIGPNMYPPAVTRREVPGDVVERLREELLRMHESDTGRAILARGQIARFAVVRDDDYDDIRRKARLAQQVKFDEV